MKYDDIMDLEHHVSKVHKAMSMHDRAAQFAPFAALTGYEDSIKEKARLTSKRIILDEDSINSINLELESIKFNIKDKPKVKIIYFIKDNTKDGGSYNTIIDNVKRIDDVLKYIKTNNYIIYFKDIVFVEKLSI